MSIGSLRPFQDQKSILPTGHQGSRTEAFGKPQSASRKSQTSPGLRACLYQPQSVFADSGSTCRRSWAPEGPWVLLSGPQFRENQWVRSDFCISFSKIEKTNSVIKYGAERSVFLQLLPDHTWPSFQTGRERLACVPANRLNGERGLPGDGLRLCCPGSLWMENLSLPGEVSAELHVMTSWGQQISCLHAFYSRHPHPCRWGKDMVNAYRVTGPFFCCGGPRRYTDWVPNLCAWETRPVSLPLCWGLRTKSSSLPILGRTGCAASCFPLVSLQSTLLSPQKSFAQHTVTLCSKARRVHLHQWKFVGGQFLPCCQRP